MSDTRNPPAFPQQCADALDVGMVHEGMSLRDWFAGQALAGLIAAPSDTPWGYVIASTKGIPPDVVAREAYVIADAMLRARGEG
jgi:hypothetical protein